MYEAPHVVDLGSLDELTQHFNKIGSTSDLYSNTTPLVGSLVSHP